MAPHCRNLSSPNFEQPLSPNFSQYACDALQLLRSVADLKRRRSAESASVVVRMNQEMKPFSCSEPFFSRFQMSAVSLILQLFFCFNCRRAKFCKTTTFKQSLFQLAQMLLYQIPSVPTTFEALSVSWKT